MARREVLGQVAQESGAHFLSGTAGGTGQGSLSHPSPTFLLPWWACRSQTAVTSVPGSAQWDSLQGQEGQGGLTQCS